MIKFNSLSFFLIEIENLVTQVDNLDSQINAGKRKFYKPRLNDRVRIRPFTVTLRLISGPYTAVISGAEIRSVNSEGTAHIRPYTLKIRHRIRHRISAPDFTGKYGLFTVPYEANYG